MFWPGQTVPPPGIEHGGSERVVRAAGPATQRNPAPPFFRRKDKGQPISLLHYFRKQIELGGWMWYDMDSIRDPAYLARLPILFYGEKEGEGGVGLHAQLQAPPVPSPLARHPKKIFQTLPQKLHMVVGHYLIIQV